MNKRNFFTLAAILGMCSSSLMLANTVSAQVSWETQQLLDETDALLRDASEFLQHTEQLRQQDMNALSSACNSGDSNACIEYKVRLNVEDRAIDNYIETSINRRLCGSPVCY